MGWILLFVITGSLLLSWWALPELRSNPLPWVRRLGRDWRRTQRGHRRMRPKKPWKAPTQLVLSYRHRLRILGMLSLLIVPPLLAWWMHDGRRVADLGVPHTASRNPQIAWLLQGEKLVPPPALPPEVFATAEVEAIRPRLTHASRDWSLLDEDFRQRLLLVYRLMRERYGYEMVLIEGYRSPQRQAELQAMGPQVTQAGPGESYHQHGLAADSAFLRDGTLVISEQDPWALEGYRLYGELAESVGLTWGGRWQMRDYGHVELRSIQLSRRHQR
ncbi:MULTISPECIES: M15 family metallopeptidase [Caldimonas]|uniref:M15 family metallopeptidase n=1 Tax=Caldimonas TaxID=196013 RepID=UPI00036B6FFE|nr:MULTISPECIES: M15 family metallopeptidase [Caldimonas]GIX25787.1 MAG: hypothetical protein KatS3mg122_3018 [Caldimonas sp.]